jgi:uncharacterized repeat protein (TIGR03803 family)
MELSLQSLVGRRRSRWPRPLPSLAAVFALGLAAGPAPAAAPSETILYKFLGGSDGLGPNAELIVDDEGTLYGTTTSGGGSSIYCAGGCGTVFKLTPPVPPATKWRETVLYSFKGGLDGNTPEAGLIFDHKGALYGTTAGGGRALNFGTVFKLTPPVPPATKWRETILHSFKGGTDGANPRAGLVFDAKGALYGTTFFGGGPRDSGTVFKLTPPVPPATRWSETVLHRFGAKHDGVNPLGGLVFDAEGALYGTTDVGNTLHSGHLGTVFKLTPFPPAKEWNETILHGFPATKTDGAQPEAGLIFDGNGALYGTTANGGKSNLGTVFRLDPISGREAVLYSFEGGTDGETPHAGVVFDREGALYGTTNEGGAGVGTVFKLDPQATVDTILHEFTGPPDGQHPAAAVTIGANGVLYGTTSEGGSLKCSCGVVFELH